MYKKTIKVVGVGASAGGRKAFEEILKALPSHMGMSFIFVQHLDPTYKSSLSMILAKSSSMPVLQAKEGMKILPSHIYTIPPDAFLTVSKGCFHLSKRKRNEKVFLPIDTLFYSLAKEFNEQVAGIVLSGVGNDGTLGLQAIKKAGGITFVQESSTAKFDAMPQSAMSASSVDFILSPSEIANHLCRLRKYPAILKALDPHHKQGPEDAESEETHLKQISNLILKKHGVDLSFYKPSTIKRRILRRASLLRLENVREYLEYLLKHTEEVTSLYQDVFIHVTSFFRNPAAFEALKRDIYPKIIQKSTQNLRVWVPACSTGEEVYSIAMSLLEYLENSPPALSIQIFATDINDEVINKARKGVYKKPALVGLSNERLRRFFTMTEVGDYKINKNVRDLCVFAKHDMIQEPPFSNLDLVTFRNLLIYLGSEVQKKILPILHYSLKHTGFLMLGNSETIGAHDNLFELINKKYKIYAKKAAPSRPFFTSSVKIYEDTKKTEDKVVTSPMKKETDLYKEADQFILSQYAPPGFIINGDLEVLQFRGQLGSYLEPAPGKASLNILKIVRNDLALELRGVINNAMKLDVSAERKEIQIHEGTQLKTINIIVSPLKHAGSGQKLFLVLFEDANASQATLEEIGIGDEENSSKKKSENKSEVLRLKKQLELNKQHLRSALEDLESTNEELKSSNEEIQSSNEELQSANEELETSKEELQSNNEELITLNEELQTRNSELTELNNDLYNLFYNINTPVIMLGNDLRIRKVTPEAEKLFHIQPNDIGRSILDIKFNVHLPKLESQILEVLDTFHEIKQEVQDKEGKWFSFEIRPYRTINKSIEGAILLFFNIDATKKLSLIQIEDAKDYAENIIRTIREPIVLLDEHLKIIQANEPFYQCFQVTQQKIEGKHFLKAGNRQWDIPALRKLLNEIATQKKEITNFELIHEFPKVGIKNMLLNARHIFHKRVGYSSMILVVFEDLTQQSRLAKKLNEASMIEQERIGKDLHDGLGQTLTSIALYSKLLEKKLNTKLKPESKMALEITERLNYAVQEVGRLARGLAPITLEEQGIVTALEELCFITERDSGIHCRFRASKSGKILSKKIKMNLYHIAQEALGNAIKYSRAKNIKMTFQIRGKLATLTIQDDGIGLPLEFKKKPGMGIRIMTYRAGEIGASLKIHSKAKHGTRIILQINLHDNDSDILKNQLYEKKRQRP